MSARTPSYVKALIALFFLVYATKLFYSDYLLWDSAVYIGMAKFIFSGGGAGLYEATRPVLLPVFIGLFWVLGFSAITAAKMVTLLFVVGTASLTFLLADELFGRRTAVVAILLLAITPVFFKYSTLPLTGIPAVFFVLASMLLMVRGNYLLAGIAAGLGFVMRFPAGLVLPVCGILLLTHRHPLRDFVKYGVYVVIGFSAVAGAYLGANALAFHDEDTTAFDAAIAPLKAAAWHQGHPAESIRGETLSSWVAEMLFYPLGIFGENPLLLFSLVGLAMLAFRRPRNTATVIIPLIVFLAYFTFIINKQFRFSLLFLPFVCILAAYGLFQTHKALRPGAAKWSLVALVIIILVFMIPSEEQRSSSMRYYTEKSGFGDSLDAALVDRGVTGPVMVTDPLPAAFIENRMFFYGFSPAEALKKFELRFEGDTLVYNPSAFWCGEGDDTCRQDKRDVLRHLMHTYNTIFYGKYFDHEYYVFSKNHSLEPIDKDMLDTDIEVVMSSNPLGVRSLVVFRIDHAFSIFREDGKNALWHEDRLREIINAFTDRQATFSLIPYDLMTMDEDNFSYVAYTVSQLPKVEIAQLGYSHEDMGGNTEFAGMSTKNQLERMQEGREFLQDRLKKPVNTFIPPFNNADDTTLRVMDGLGYRVFSSTPGNLIGYSGSVSRYDLDISFLEWNDGRSNPRSLDSLKAEFDHYYGYRDHIVLSLSYTTYPDMGAVRGLLDYVLTKDVQLASLGRLDDWYRFRRAVQFTSDKDSITISIPEDVTQLDGLTLEFEQSGNYTLASDYDKQLYLYNRNIRPVAVCLNTGCLTLQQRTVVPYETKYS